MHRRDCAIVVVLLYTGLRLAELVALDVDDVARERRRALRQGDSYRKVPLNALVRQVLEEWLADRQARAGESGRCSLGAAGGGFRSARSMTSSEASARMLA